MGFAWPLAMIQKRPFYWTAFRIFEEPDAQWFMGRTVLTNGEFWLNLRNEDFVRCGFSASDKARRKAAFRTF
jgi:hypothetical protein